MESALFIWETLLALERAFKNTYPHGLENTLYNALDQHFFRRGGQDSFEELIKQKKRALADHALSCKRGAEQKKFTKLLAVEEGGGGFMPW